MTIDKKMYENIIKERDEIISRLEEDLVEAGIFVYIDNYG